MSRVVPMEKPFKERRRSRQRMGYGLAHRLEEEHTAFMASLEDDVIRAMRAKRKAKEWIKC